MYVKQTEDFAAVYKRIAKNGILPHIFHFSHLPPTPHDMLLVPRQEKTYKAHTSLSKKCGTGRTVRPKIDGLEKPTLLQSKLLELCRWLLLHHQSRLVLVHRIDGIPVNLDKIHRP